MVVGSAISTFVPHEVQKAASLGRGAPQLGQVRPSGVPHLAQNRAPSGFS